jgi:hypothetical protein
MKDLVECHSGTDYAERPKALVWEGQRLEVVEVLARWRIPGSRCFTVRTADDQAFELVYSELEDSWSIHSLGYLGPAGASARNKN